MSGNIRVFKESEIGDLQLTSSPSIEPVVEQVKKEILKSKGDAALLSDVCKEIDVVDAKQTSALYGKIKRFCGENGQGGLKVIRQGTRNILVRTVE